MNRRLWMLLVVLSGCSLRPVPRLPMKVAPEEYEVYSAWLRHHFKQQPSGTLYLANLTVPANESHCSGKELRKAGGDEELLRQLDDLGDAQFPLNLPNSLMHAAWDYKITYGLSSHRDAKYEEVVFSRVAFNARHTEALFAVSVGCGGLCGNGGLLLGRRENGTWVFRDSGCVWIF